MSSETVIEITGLSKSFTVKTQTTYGGTKKIGTRLVLSNISISLNKGEIVGIIGKNGSGKSTLLKILSGIISPDEGTVQVRGHIASILELGLGFNPELSGRENIHLKCGMFGLESVKINKIEEKIIEFSENNEQIDQPLRTYSSGMIAKLALSILIYIDYDILILDEALSVGDASFNEKCKHEFKKLKATGKTIIIASHNLNTISSMCDNVIWIDSGIVKEQGSPNKICYNYEHDSEFNYEKICKMAEKGDIVAQNRAGILCKDGINTPLNLDEAEKWFLRAASSGNVDSLINLSDVMLLKGDVDSANNYLTKAYNMGSELAKIKLELLTNKTIMDNNEFVDNIEILMKNGNLLAQKLMADILSDGTLVPKNLKSAYDLYLKCANEGDGPSQYIVGIWNREGIGTIPNMDQSIIWLKTAAENGHIQSKLQLANMYKNGIGVERDENQAIQWLMSAAKDGETSAYKELSQIYIEKDRNLSDYWQKRYSITKKMLFILRYAHIKRMESAITNDKSFIELFEKLAEEHNKEAMTTLVAYYKNGYIVEKNEEKAQYWIKKLSEAGHAPSMYDLALKLLSLNDDAQNCEAYYLVKQAASRGYIPAMKLLIHLTYCGIGAEKNIDDCKKWIKRLTELGDKQSYIMQQLIENNQSLSFEKCW